MLLKQLFCQRCVNTKFRTPYEIGSVKKKKNNHQTPPSNSLYKKLMVITEKNQSCVMNSKTYLGSQAKRPSLQGKIYLHTGEKSSQFSHVTVSHGLSPGQRHIFYNPSIDFKAKKSVLNGKS